MANAKLEPMSDPEFKPEIPVSVPLHKVYIHVGHDKIWFGRGGDLKRGGLIRERTESFGPQRDPLERLPWARDKVDNFKDYLFNEPSHLAQDAEGNYNDIDGGGRALIAHIMGHQVLSAFVSKNLSLVQIASRFREHAHAKVSLGAIQDFLAQVAEGSKMHVQIKNALAPNYKVKKSGVDAINSVKALTDVYQHGGHDDLSSVALIKRTAQLCGNTWGPKFERTKGKQKRIAKGKHVPGIVFVAVALVIQSLPKKQDEEKLRKALASFTPSSLSEAAEEDNAKLAQLTAKRSSSVAFKLLSQHLGPLMAMELAKKYNSHLDGAYEKIDLTEINNSILAQKFSKLR